MALRKYNAKRDENEPEIVTALNRLGCLVYRLDKPFDLLVFIQKAKKLVLVEVKMPGQKFNTNQLATLAYGWPVTVLRSADEAIEFVKVITQADALEDAA